MSTVCNFVTEVLETECIGRSLNTFNNNFINCRNFICVVDNQLDIVKQRLDDLTTTVDSISSEQLAKAWILFKGHIDKSGLVDGGVTPSDGNRLILNQYNVLSAIKNSVGDYTLHFPVTALDPNQIPTPTTLAKTVSALVVNSLITPNYIYDGLTEVGVITYHPTTPFPTAQTMRLVTSNLTGGRFDPDLISLSFYN